MDKIIVGVDGSPSSRRALAWALDEAVSRGASVAVLYAYANLQTAFPYTIEELIDEMPTYKIIEEAGHRLIEDMLNDVGVPAGVRVEAVVVEGPPANALVQRSTDTDLIVVGSRGHGGFGELLMGSVSHQTALHARCPVTIVPHETHV
jgi:nucleotide-binding universal stress UspA family protein